MIECNQRLLGFHETELQSGFLFVDKEGGIVNALNALRLTHVARQAVITALPARE